MVAWFVNQLDQSLSTMSPTNNNESSQPKAKFSWKKSSIRETLKNDILEGRITPEMKPSQAVEINPLYKEMGKLFASRLSGMRKILAQPQKEPKKEKWRQKNPARIQMKWDVADGIITANMDFATAKTKRALYGKMTDDQFKSRLTGMRTIVKKALERANEDEAALEADLILRPRKTTNHRGEPEWHSSDAKSLLCTDMDAKLHEKMSPMELWESREEYKKFWLSTFRGHIYQEVQTRKWRDQWVDGKKDYTIVLEPHAVQQD